MAKKLIALLLPILFSHLLIAQINSSYSVGKVKAFTGQFMNANAKTGKNTVLLPVDGTKTFEIEVNINSVEDGDYKVIGGVKGHEHATFAFYGNEKAIEGHILFLKTKSFC